MRKKKKKVIRIFKCPIEGCKKQLGYVKGEEAWCIHGGIAYKMNEAEVEEEDGDTTKV